MKSVQFINSIKEIATQYDYFIFDVWGVIHDGSKTYDGAIEAISYLRSLEKKICFLSNAPRRAKKVEEALNKFGVTKNLYDFVMSSGEATFLSLKQNQELGFQSFGKGYFYIGPKKDIDLLEGLNYERSKTAENANFVITTGFDLDESTIDEKMPQILEAKKFNLPMICVNPDMIVVKQSGQEMNCAGLIAKEYKKIGGTVIYYGKPYESVYEATCASFKTSNKSKIIAIGDGLETDIAGASKFGIDCLLITGGILSKTLKINYNQNANPQELEKIFNQLNLFPQFTTSNLKL